MTCITIKKLVLVGSRNVAAQIESVLKKVIINFKIFQTLNFRNEEQIFNLLFHLFHPFQFFQNNLSLVLDSNLLEETFQETLLHLR